MWLHSKLANSDLHKESQSWHVSVWRDIICTRWAESLRPTVMCAFFSIVPLFSTQWLSLPSPPASLQALWNINRRAQVAALTVLRDARSTTTPPFPFFSYYFPPCLPSFLSSSSLLVCWRASSFFFSLLPCLSLWSVNISETNRLWPSRITGSRPPTLWLLFFMFPYLYTGQHQPFPHILSSSATPPFFFLFSHLSLSLPGWQCRSQSGFVYPSSVTDAMLLIYK